MNEFTLLIPVMILVAGIRLLPSWFHPLVGSDEGFHLLMRREIRRNGFRVPGKLDVCIFDRRLTYPWLYHQLIAFLPEAWLRRVPALPSAIIDGMHSALAYVAGWGMAHLLSFPECAPWAGFWSALLFGINPALLAHGMGPRAYHTTPRPLGEFLFSLSLLSSILAIHQASWGWAILSAAAGGAMLLSSKFAAQVMVFFVPFLAMVPGYSAVLLVLPASFAAALIWSRGRYVDVLRGQIGHLTYFRRKVQYTFSPVTGRNRWQDFGRIGSAIRRHGLFSKPVLQAAGYVYTTNTYLLVLSRGGLYVVLLVCCASAGFRESLQIGVAPARWMLAWAFVWIFPFVLTSMKHFRFLGEAERYAEYGVLPAALLVGVGLAVAPLSSPLLAVLGLYGLCSAGVIGHAWATNVRAARRNPAERNELVSFLQTLPADSVLMGVPSVQVLCPVASLLPHRLADATSSDGFVLVDIQQRLFEGYPWPKPDWKKWQELGVQYVVTFSLEYLRQHRPSMPYDRIPMELIYSNASYRVYVCPEAPGSGSPPEGGTRAPAL